MLLRQKVRPGCQGNVKGPVNDVALRKLRPG